MSYIRSICQCIRQRSAYQWCLCPLNIRRWCLSITTRSSRRGASVSPPVHTHIYAYALRIFVAKRLMNKTVLQLILKPETMWVPASNSDHIHDAHESQESNNLSYYIPKNNKNYE